MAATATARPPLSKSLNSRLLLLAGLLLGFGLRLHRLGTESLWYDETVSLFLARQPVPELIAHTARDIHPPGYYLLLHAWARLADAGLTPGLEFVFAFPSLLFGMLLLPLLYALGRRLLPTGAALLAVWIGAAHPFHIWYSQEVRMYTLGAALGLLCLYALLRWQAAPTGSAAWRWLTVYVLAGAAGLYSLYYFAFLLSALFFIGLARTPAPHRQGRKLTGQWLLAQAAVLLLWSPWLPTFLRQISQPPVPPWRGLPGLAQMAGELLAGLVVGQSPPGWLPPSAGLWLWAGMGLLLLLGLGLAGQRRAYGLLAVYTFLPALLIVLLSFVLAPLYHIRYFFIYAGAVPLLLAGAVQASRRISRWLPPAALLLLFAASAGSLTAAWYAPAYRADDHRGAVAALARQWRPGDVLLVNAGWAYPALDAYWPNAPAGPDDSRPPAFGWQGRLTDYAQIAAAPGPSAPLPVALRTGSVDGPASLGWGLAASDFYPMPRQQAAGALAALAQKQPRIWHYRIYDTVSDPDGFVRAWLGSHIRALADAPIPGRDFGRVQLYATAAAPRNCPQPRGLAIPFGDALTLLGWELPLDRAATTATATAGTPLYVTACWRAEPGLADFPAGLRTSLRLYRESGDPAQPARLIAQQDESPRQATSEWTPGAVQRMPLALPLPAALPPGTYRLALLVYDSATGAPLPVSHPRAQDGSALLLAEDLQILPPSQPPPVGPPAAVFDYIELLASRVENPAAQPGESLRLDLLWRPRPSAYRDTYRAVLRLEGAIGAQVWTRAPVHPANPSGGWQPGFPLAASLELPLPPDLPPGDYSLHIRLERASDGLAIPARTGPLPWQTRPSYPIARVSVGTAQE